MSRTLTADRLRERMRAGLRRRHFRERVFRAVGFFSVTLSIVFLLTFLVSITAKGASSFFRGELELTIVVEQPSAESTRPLEEYLLDAALARLLPGEAGAEELRPLISAYAATQIRRAIGDEPISGARVNVRIPVNAAVDAWLVSSGVDDTDLSSLPAAQQQWVSALERTGQLARTFNADLFMNGDSREPELAGLRAAIVGSFWMLLITIVLAVPIGIAAAVYLEEFAARNRWTDLIEVNINNLAAVPSIVYGLLGVAVFINGLALPRSAPLVGGMILALMSLPLVIISTRAAIQGVPNSRREAALALGASKMQTVAQHVLPEAIPGILTGTVLAMSRALGETAPLLMIGMVAFVVDPPASPLQPATALPVQAYLWADSPELAYVGRAAAAIVVLMVFLLAMNMIAFYFRRRTESIR